jgi:hypothetical protein
MIDFPKIYLSSNLPPHEIFKKSLYSKFRDQITIEFIASKIENNNSIIEMWLHYSEDQRHSPTWTFDKISRGNFIIAYISESYPYKIAFSNPNFACAFMIKMVFEDLMRFQ